MKMAMMHTAAPVKKSQSLTCAFSAISTLVFMQQKTCRRVVKDISNDI